MDIESAREYCLSLPCATEDMPFGDGVVVFRVCGKIFGCLSVDSDDYFALKCDPEYAIELRERYEGIEPAYHWNKKYWNQVRLGGSLPDDFLRALIRHSYAQVAAKLPRKDTAAPPEITALRQ